MATPMVRKQLYLARDQDRKLKTVASSRGYIEAEVIRDALDDLPDRDLSILDQLAATGLLSTA